MKHILLVSILITIVSCQYSKKKADLIVTNAIVYTIDDDFSMAESFAIVDGVFAAIGSEKEILKQYGSEKIVNANGKYIYPGFNDAHCHFYELGINLLNYADLSGTKSKEEIIQRLQNHYKKYGGVWLLGRGWDQNDWDIKEFPTKHDLDTAFPDVPVYLYRIDGHAGWCNSKALQMAGITKSQEVSGGKMLIKNGEPTGVFIDAAKSLIQKVIPKPGKEQIIKGLLLAQEACLKAGLTSVTDCGLSKNVILLMDELQQTGKLKIRINAMISPRKENMEYFLKNGIYKSERLQVNTIKLFADGALGSRGALLLKDYSDDPDNKGLQTKSTDELRRIMQEAFDAGYQVATHCIGDSANRIVLDLYGEFLKTKNDRRWRIEHAQVVHPDDIKKFEQFSVVPSIQATHATSDMYWAGERLEQKRLKYAYAYQDLLQTNGWLPNGTDFPAEKIDPLLTFCASVFRQDTNGFPETGFQIENALSREQTLRSMTIWAAKSEFQEDTKGSIEPGKQADFIILDKDLLSADREEIINAHLINNFINGEQVYPNLPSN